MCKLHAYLMMSSGYQCYFYKRVNLIIFFYLF